MRKFSYLFIPLMMLALSACDAKLEGFNPFFDGAGGGNRRPFPTPTPSSQSFFAASVKPAFEARCISCHSKTFVFGAAPSSIYTEQSVRPFLTNGSSSELNALMDYARGLVPNHSDTCAGNSNETPCLEIKEWYRREVASSGENALPAGRVDSIDVFGEIRGASIDPDSSAAVQVSIYLNGPMGTGTLLSTVTANQNFGYILGLHGFKYTLPVAARDGSTKSVYVYATDLQNGQVSQLGQSPKSFRLYAPKQAGKDFYNANIVPKFQARCTSCHALGSAIFDHDSMFYSVGNTSPTLFSGTATNNALYNKTSGQNHSGGAFCSGANNPCPDIQTWFGMQFN